MSSTGHLILAGDLLDFDHPSRDVFYIAIQTGAMLAVLWEYRARFFRVDLQLWRNLIVAFIPAAVMGLAFGNLIKTYLFKPVPVALAFIIGGVIILRVDRGTRPVRIQSTRDMTWLDALKVGFAQCFALIPGTSRSGATIIGGMLFGLSRQAATEFSFFLSVPIMFAATGYQMVKYRGLFTAADIGPFAVGFVVSFLSALLAVRALIRYVARHDFNAFAWYRIALGVIVLAYFAR